MDKHGKPTTPDQPATAATAAAHGLETKFAATLNFSLRNQGLQILSKASTIMLEAIVMDAVTRLDLVPWTEKPLPEDGIISIEIEYDMVRDALDIKCNGGGRVLAKGVLTHALGAVTRNQTAQNFANYKNAMELRVKALEDRAGVQKIILPGRG